MARKASGVPIVASDYFNSGADADTILRSFGFAYATDSLTLPCYTGELDFIADLDRKIAVGTGRFTLSSVFYEARTVRTND